MKLFNNNIIKEGGRNPHVDWSMILIVFLIIAVIFIVNNVLLYQRVVSGDIQSPNVDTSSRGKTYNQKDSDIVIKMYAEKADAFSAAKKGYTAHPDPSRP